MRISDASSQQQVTLFTLQARDRFAAQQAKIASGKHQIRRSEDPRQAAAASQAATALETLERRRELLDTASYSQTQTEASLTSILDTVQRLRELVVSANDGTKSTADRQSMAEEVDSLLESLVALGNRQVDGNYLFAGESGQQPIQVTRTGDRLTAATVSNSVVTAVRLEEGIRLPLGAVAGGDGGVFANAGTDYDLLNRTIVLRDRLAAGELPTEDDLTYLDQGLHETTGAVVMSGIDKQRLESIGSQLSSLELGERTRLEGLTSLDMSTAVIELNRLQVTYQASLQMAANVQRLSMVQFI